MRKVLFLILSAVLMAGCSQSNEMQLDRAKIKVALIAKSEVSYFWQVVFAGAKSAAVEYGIDVDMYAPETEYDYQTQIKFIEDAINNKYDAILFSACDYAKTVPAIEAAMDLGIKVVTIDSGIGTDRDVIFIGTDNVNAGYKAGEALSTFCNDEFKIGIISFEEFSANGIERNEGFKKYIDEHPNMNIVDLRYCISNREDPKNATIEMLNEHPEINAIATFNEWTTLGVGDAISERGLGNSVSVVAFDNNEESIVLLEKGIIDALIVQNPFAMGYLGVENAISQIERHKLTEITIHTESVAITKDNMFTAQNQKLLFPFAQ